MKLIRFLKDLRPDQRAVAESRARFKVVACGRRWGKTTLGLVMAAEAARRGQRVWWVAPTYSLAFHPWRDLKAMLAAEKSAKLESEKHIDLPGGGSITIKSAEDPDSLRGVGLDLVIIDEAAFISELAWYGSIRPALSDLRGKALIISTPRGRNWFFAAYQMGQQDQNPDWESWQAPTVDNPVVGEQEVEEARRMLPERIFQQEYLAEFLPDGGEVFHRVREAATAPENAKPIPGHRYVMGVDFGRHHDFTALAVIDMSANQMVALDRFGGVDWTMQRNRIAAFARQWNVEEVMAEANAMGEPNIDQLRHEGVPIYPFVTTAHSKGPLIEMLVKGLESKELAILPDELLLGELEAYRYDVLPYTGANRYFAPPGLHDDTVIALALAWKVVTRPRIVFGVLEW